MDQTCQTPRNDVAARTAFEVKAMTWPEYMAKLLNRLTALTDPKAVVTLKAGDMVREIHAAFEAGKAQDESEVGPTK